MGNGVRASAPSTTVTKEILLKHLYGGTDEPELKIIDVFVCKLRKSWRSRPAANTTLRPYGAAVTNCATQLPMPSATLVVGVEDRDARDDGAGSRAV